MRKSAQPNPLSRFGKLGLSHHGRQVRKGGAWKDSLYWQYSLRYVSPAARRTQHLCGFVDLSEEQIVHTFGTVGHVINFRLVYDNETGRPKGFGFMEFADTDAAASAVRNMNNHEIMGRELRVDFSHVGGKDDQAPANYTAQPPPPLPLNGHNKNQQPAPPTSSSLPPLPPGVDLQPGLTSPDAISKTLATLPAPQLLDILSQMKGLVMGDPAKATELLQKAPQLSYAIFQALLLMGLVDTSVLGSVVEQASQPQPIPQAPPQQAHIPLPRPPPAFHPPPPQQQPGYPPYQQMPSGPMHVSTPPIHHPAYQPPPQMPQAPPLQPAQPTGQEELLKQVLAMTQQQIDSLPPHERSQIVALRQQLMGGRY